MLLDDQGGVGWFHTMIQVQLMRPGSVAACAMREGETWVTIEVAVVVVVVVVMVTNPTWLSAGVTKMRSDSARTIRDTDQCTQHTGHRIVLCMSSHHTFLILVTLMVYVDGNEF